MYKELKGFRVYAIITAVALLFTGFLWGGVVQNEVYGYSIDSSQSSWAGNKDTVASGSTCAINHTGKYKIELYGGAVEVYNTGYTTILQSGGGGHIIATTKLKKGDILQYVVYQGATAPPASSWLSDNCGGNAVMIFLNGTALVGAGGRGGCSYINGNSRLATGQDVHGALPSPVVGSAINNAKFSAGGYGTTMNGSGYQYSSGIVNAQTLAGCTFAQNAYWLNYAVYPAESGSNYLDTTRAILVSAPNDSTVNDCRFSVAPIEVTQSDAYEYIAEALQGIEAKIGNMGGSSTPQEIIIAGDTQYPSVEVVQNQTFDITLGCYDDMNSGTSGTVSVENPNRSDGMIKLKGKMTEVGIFKVTIQGKNFIIKVIAPPDAVNVTVRLE